MTKNKSDLSFSDFEKACNEKVYCKDCIFCRNAGKSFARCMAVKTVRYDGIAQQGAFIDLMEMEKSLGLGALGFPNKDGTCKHYKPNLPKRLKDWLNDLKNKLNGRK